MSGPGVTAVVLAGGKATRMGGGDKGLLPLAGQPILSHVLARVRPQVRAMVLNANGDLSRFAAFGLPMVADTPPGEGPLAGVLAGMRWTAQTHPDIELVLSVPTDTPVLPLDLVERMLAARAEAGAAIACAASVGRRHPVVALWPVALADTLAAVLATGERRVGPFAAAHGLAVAEFSDEPFDPFVNINDPAALADAEVLLRQV